MQTENRISYRRSQAFTLVELVIVIVIVGIMAGVGIRSILRIGENRAFRITLQRMDDIRYAIAGNPYIIADGTRLQYGYVGDTGEMPSTLNDLVTDPGVDNWQGPYLDEAKIQQDPTAIFRDGWNNAITYYLPSNTAEAPTLTSTSGGGEDIVLSISPSVDDLVNNTVALRILNEDDYPIRGTDGTVALYYGGAWHEMSYSGEQGFYLSTVPIGAVKACIVLSGDTTYRIINVGAGNSTTSPDMGLEFTVHPEYGTLAYVGGSLSIGGINNSEITFDIENTGSTVFEVIEVQFRWNNSDCWECDYAYISSFEINTAQYWAWNTNNRTTLGSNGARLLLDETLDISKGSMTIGPVGFQTEIDGSGSEQPMDDVDFTVSFYSSIAPPQAVSFSSSGTCTPAVIVQTGATASGGTSPLEDVEITLQNNGDAPVTLTGLTIVCDTTDIFLDEIAFGSSTETYWQARQNWCNNYEGRKEMDDVGGTTITFCKTQPAPVIYGNDSEVLYLLNFFSDPNETDTAYHQDMQNRTFTITLHFECGDDQSVTATT